MSLEQRDITQLKKGWEVGFGDAPDFVDYFFNHYDDDATRLVRRNEEGEIVAQMHYFLFRDEVCGECGCYIYGVTTLPEYRGKGYAREMIGECINVLREQNVAYAVLIAQDSMLQDWYRTLGFIADACELVVCGKCDNMNFATEDISLNKGMYYFLKPTLSDVTHRIEISPVR